MNTNTRTTQGHPKEQITVRDLSCGFISQGQTKTLFSDLTMSIHAGQVIGISGASGCGKTTLLNCLAGFIRPTKGHIDYHFFEPDGRQNTAPIQLVFQNARASLNPAHRVGFCLQEALNTGRKNTGLKYAKTRPQLCGLVSLNTALLRKYPHQLSGGEVQQVCLARALAAHPVVLLMDEPTRSLDPTAKLELLDQLKKLSTNLALTLVIASHDDAALSYIGARSIAMPSRKQSGNEGFAQGLSAVPTSYNRGVI